MGLTAESAQPGEGYRHEAFLWSGEDEFLSGTVPFVEEAVDQGQPILVALIRPRLEWVRRELGGTPEGVVFVDMAELGRNPARIIPAWRAFVDDNGGGSRPLRGIGEPVWAGRPDVELVECQRHEALLNVAFARSGAWRLLCPYDLEALPGGVIEAAERSHPWLSRVDGTRNASRRCLDLDDMAKPFDAPLPAPPRSATAFHFGLDTIARVREHVTEVARQAGLTAERTEDLVLAVHEIATNSVLHGGGRGTVRTWRDVHALVCEVADRGRIDLPLVGRERPSPERNGGRGVWMANQLCDLVQIRTFDDGNVVRLHFRLD